MGVNLRSAQINMPKLLLNRADVGARFEQVGGKGVAQCVAAGGFLDVGGAEGALQGFLDR